MTWLRTLASHHLLDVQVMPHYLYVLYTVVHRSDAL
jgi:hypothetical protein